jgi:tryptophan synthase beta chain
MSKPCFGPMPDEKGYFGEYGGQIIPPDLLQAINDIAASYLEIRNTDAFQDELRDLYSHYVGRASLYFPSFDNARTR